MVKVRSFAAVQAESREAVREYLRSRPLPRVLNAAAILELEARVRFAFAGRTYEAPPLAYADGVRLSVLQNRFAHLARTPIGRDALAEHARCCAEAAAVLLRVARPVSGAGPDLTDASEAELAALVALFLFVPDESPQQFTEEEPQRRAAVIDLADGLFEFVRAYGHRPRLWREYVLGQRALGREWARGSIRDAHAVAAAFSDKDGWRTWHSRMAALAGWQ